MMVKIWQARAARRTNDPHGNAEDEEQEVSGAGQTIMNDLHVASGDACGPLDDAELYDVQAMSLDRIWECRDDLFPLHWWQRRGVTKIRYIYKT